MSITRYIIENKFISNISGNILTVEHGVTYESLEAAAKGQKDHVVHSEYLCVGFRIIELREVVSHDDH